MLALTADLLANFAVVGLFVAVWALSQEWVRTWTRAARVAGSGLLMGLGAAASMELSVELFEGMRFDLRGVLLALGGMFGGPVAALVAALLASLARFAIGGSGVWGGVLMIGLYSGVGCAGYFARRFWGLTLPLVFMVSLALAAMPLLSMLLVPPDMRQVAVATLLLPFIVMTGVSSFFAILAIERSRYRGWLTHIMRMAMGKAPDYFYIKDRNGRIVVANDAAARAAGKTVGADIVGLTDFQLVPREEAEILFALEQDMLRAGGNIVDYEEQVPQRDGSVRTLVTTKRSIFNADGSVAGLVGVTKDLTERLALERKVTETRAELDVVLNEMSDGLARFDKDCRLVFSNQNYQALFPLTASVRQPGTHLRDILQAVLDTGEQVLSEIGAEQWVEAVLANMEKGGEEQVRMYDGRWLLVRSTPMRAGGTVVIVSDISGLKLAESNLMDVAEQMRVLSITDALTGLHNRRDFDDGLALYLERVRRDGGELSVVLIDIDRFKAYNDTYGHPAGDACLRRVAGCIRDSAMRPADMAARLGGEEFAVLLPATDLAGAEKVADDIRQAVEAMQLPHSGAEHGYLTISAGVASVGRDGHIETGLELMEAADHALYAAKAGGRNQVVSASAS